MAVPDRRPVASDFDCPTQVLGFDDEGTRGSDQNVVEIMSDSRKIVDYHPTLLEQGNQSSRCSLLTPSAPHMVFDPLRR